MTYFFFLPQQVFYLDQAEYIMWPVTEIAWPFPLENCLRKYVHIYFGQVIKPDSKNKKQKRIISKQIP